MTKQLINRFIGLSSFMARKLSKMVNPTYKNQAERVPQTLGQSIFSALLVILYISSMVFILISLDILRPEAITYYRNKEFLEILQVGFKTDFTKFVDGNVNTLNRVKQFFTANVTERNKFIIMGDIIIDTVSL